MTRNQQLIAQSSSDAQKTKNTDALSYVSDTVFQSIYNQFFTTEENKVVTSPTMNAKLKDLNEKNPELAEAARAIFFQGNNYLNPGGPNTYEVYDDFLAKFMLHDEKGRGGSPSVTERAFVAMGLKGEYNRVKGVIEGKDVKAGLKGSVEHQYIMDSANRMVDQGQRTIPFKKDILDEFFSNQDGTQSAFLKTLDAAGDNLGMTYEYRDNVLYLVFKNESDSNKFRQMLQERYPGETSAFIELIRNGMIGIETK
tara:strand:- start:1577 stop:2338 length:762 start_codon:yes stop_codon:yes gene_type:complete